MKPFKLTCLLLILTFFAPVARAQAAEKVVIAQFGKEKFLLYLPLYIAMEEGLFAKRGLDIDLKFAGNDDQIFASVMGGSADFGVGDPVFAAIAEEKGGPGKVVAMMVTKLPFYGYTNKPGLGPITSLRQLNKVRISSLPEPSTTYTLLSQMKRDSAPGMKIVQATVGAQLAALEAGQVDIALDLEPAVSVAEDKGYKVVFDFEKYMQPQAITGLTTTEAVIEKKPAAVQKVVSALQEAMVLFHTQPDVCLRVAKKLFPDLKENVIKAALARMSPPGSYPDSIVVTDSYWQRSLKTRLDSGELHKPQATAVTVDNRFALQAQKEMAAAKK